MIAAALAALGLAYLYASREYPLDSLASPGPGIFPVAAGAALLILALCQAAADAVERRRGARERPHGYRSPYQRRAPIFMAVLLVAYAAGVPVLGFLTASAALVVLAARLMGLSSWPRAIALAAGVTAAVYAVFDLWLGVPLPRGLLG